MDHKRTLYNRRGVIMGTLLPIQSCENTNYYDFIEYALRKSDYFMLVYVNYENKGLSAIEKKIKKALKPYYFKKRTDPSWPGTPLTYCRNTTYQIIFYHSCSEAKQILFSVNNIFQWSRPTHPQDLAFFVKNRCWCYTTGHEEIMEIINPDSEDIDFLKLHDMYDERSIIHYDLNYIEDILQ